MPLPSGCRCKRGARLRRTARGRPLDGRLLGGFAARDDVAVPEEDPLRDLAPEWRAPQQELQVHAEVLELLALRIGHDRARFAVGLEGEALLIPPDRLG